MATAPLAFAKVGFSFIMGLLAAHDHRMAIAKEENAANNQALAALDADMKTIFDAVNKGDMTPGTAIAACQDVRNWYWSFITPFQQGSRKGDTCGCDKAVAVSPTVKNYGTSQSVGSDGVGQGTARGSCYACQVEAPCQMTGAGDPCTAACCIGCNVVNATIVNAIWALYQPKGATFQVCGSAANKYGAIARAPYNLTWKPPAHETGAEVTINVKTGIVTVGAPPSGNDAVILSGVQAIGSSPDTGGDVIQHNVAGQDVNVTAGGFASSIPGGMWTLVIAFGALLFVAMRPRTA